MSVKELCMSMRVNKLCERVACEKAVCKRVVCGRVACDRVACKKAGVLLPTLGQSRLPKRRG